ncbi:tape measure protein [Caproiciproducens sp.]|uniref:tape measure protein n=1 Tax=Caproiciproducens sp. TaxID=1954376 RepID=UPI0028985B9F|nr:tape measure protein [Caproiciproducens sp.]
MANELRILIGGTNLALGQITTIKNSIFTLNNEAETFIKHIHSINSERVVLRFESGHMENQLKMLEERAVSLKSTVEPLNQSINNLQAPMVKTVNQINNVATAASKAGNKAESIDPGKEKNIATSELGKMAIDTALNVVSTTVGSAFGAETQTMFSSVAGGAINGAIAGAAIPVIGPAIGGLVGGALGTINGLNEIKEKKDDAFKTDVQESYNDIKKSQEQTLSRGTEIASGREQDKLSFSNSLGGNEAAADELVSKISGFASNSPIPYDELAGISKTLLSNGYRQDDIIPMLSKLGDAGTALGMSGEEINAVAASLGNMKLSGKASMDDLNALQSRGISVWDYLAKGLNTSQENAQKMVAGGKLSGDQASRIISDTLGTTYSGSMGKQKKTFQGTQTAYNNAKDELDAAMGSGYNQQRKSGLEEQTKWMQGENGTKMKDAYSMIGEWKASLDNTHDESVQKSMTHMMETTDYKEAAKQNDRVKMGQLLAQAQVQGENEYKASAGYQLQLKSDLDLAAGIRNDKSMKESYWNTGYVMGQQFSTGMDAAPKSGLYGMVNPGEAKPTAKAKISGMAGITKEDPKQQNKKISGATGFFRIPYNNFPALLHEGETVSTAVEARSAKNYPNVTITGNSFVVREEADIDKIARAFVEKLTKISAVAIAS